MLTWVLIVIIVAIAACVRVLPDNQRLAIVKSGQVVGVRGPGITMIVPILEKGVRIDLDRDIPGWRSLSAEKLIEQIRLCIRL